MDLEKNFIVRYVLGNSVPKELQVLPAAPWSSSMVVRVVENRGAARLAELVTTLAGLAHAGKSISFATRFRIRHSIPIRVNLTPWSLLRHGYFRAAAQSILASRHSSRLSIGTLQRLVDFLSDYTRIIRRLQGFDCALLLSTGAVTGAENSVLLGLKTQGVPSLLVMENWDNLTSKSILLRHPSTLGVWGEQCVNYAQSIHGVDPSRIRIVGSGRLPDREADSERASFSGEAEHRDSDDRRHVLFLGSGRYHTDELALLVEVLQVCSEQSKDVVVHYRPHPANQPKREQLEQLRAWLDSGALSLHSTDGVQDAFYSQSSLESLDNQLTRSALVLGTQSTSLLEALRHGKRVISFGAATVGPLRGTNVWDQYLHLRGVKGFCGLRIVTSLVELRREVAQALSEDPPNPSDISSGVDRVVGFGKLEWRRRIIQELDVLADQSNR